MGQGRSTEARAMSYRRAHYGRGGIWVWTKARLQSVEAYAPGERSRREGIGGVGLQSTMNADVQATKGVVA